jgi:hypothetical protein
MNVRGPCSSCGAQLATDQRYCVECGQRVGPPMALPYALPAPLTEPPAASGWALALPIPIQMASTFAAIALGFGVVVGTAISPNVGGILAAPAPTVVAQAPPPVSPPPAGGGGGGGGPAPVVASAAPLATVSPTTSSGSGSGGSGGGGGGKKKKKKTPKEQPITFDGTVVRVNPVAQSYTIASNGGLIAIHTDAPPQAGGQVHVPVRKLKNGSYAEQGARSQTGTTDNASFLGTVTYCADLERPSAPCDGGTSTDHYVYSVSSLGASVLVSAPLPAQGAPPPVGSQVQVGVHIGAAFQPIAPTDPAEWKTDPSCTPPYNEQTGLPAPPVTATELTQTSVSTTATATNATLEAVVQTSCPSPTPNLVLSADDVRGAGRDLAALPIPTGIDPAKLTPGEAVQAALAVAGDGTLTLQGITSDQGTAGADDSTQGQGTLTGS